MRTSYRERDYAYGATMLTLRTAIGLTQKGLAKHLGVSRRAVGDWEAGSTYPKAESFLQRALAIREKQLGKTHPDTATSLNNLASVYEGQGRHMEAERLYIRVLTIREHLLGQGHPDTQTTRESLAALAPYMKPDARPPIMEEG